MQFLPLFVLKEFTQSAFGWIFTHSIIKKRILLTGVCAETDRNNTNSNTMKYCLLDSLTEAWRHASM